MQTWFGCLKGNEFPLNHFPKGNDLPPSYYQAPTPKTLIATQNNNANVRSMGSCLPLIYHTEAGLLVLLWTSKDSEHACVRLPAASQAARNPRTISGHTHMKPSPHPTWLATAHWIGHASALLCTVAMQRHKLNNHLAQIRYSFEANQRDKCNNTTSNSYVQNWIHSIRQLVD